MPCFQSESAAPCPKDGCFRPVRNEVLPPPAWPLSQEPLSGLPQACIAVRKTGTGAPVRSSEWAGKEVESS